MRRRMMLRRPQSRFLPLHLLSTCRSFSVKELSWCAPSGSPNRHTNQKPTTHADAKKNKNVDASTSPPVDRFGIVAAMSRNRVIGLNGKLPWNIPDDRLHFKTLTRDKVLIIGRKTYHDTPNEHNIHHVRTCLVVSRTAPINLGSDRVHVVRSFPEALQRARDLSSSTARDGKDASLNDIDCWVAGGQEIFAEALRHSSAYEVHLTMVDTTIDIHPTQDGTKPEVAFFPPKYRWDRFYDKISEQPGTDTTTPCTYVVYRRKSTMT